MRPALTRSVIRHILRNEPIIFRGCLHHASRLQAHARPHNALPQSIARQQRRTLFGFTMLRDIEPTAIPNAGLATMIEAYKRQQMNARLPPTAELLAAWRVFFASKAERKELILDTQTPFLLAAFQGIQADIANGAEIRSPLTAKEYAAALSRLNWREQVKDRRPDIKDPSFALLAREVWAAYKMAKASEELGSENKTRHRFIVILAHTGHNKDARQILVESNYTKHQVWAAVIRSYIDTKDVAEFKETMEVIRDFDANLYTALTFDFLQVASTLNETELVESLLQTIDVGIVNAQLRDRHENIFDGLEAAVAYCIRQGDTQNGQKIIQTIMTSEALSTTAAPVLKQKAWPMIFVWALGSGKAIEEIDRMVKVAQQNDPDLPVNYIFSALLGYTVEINNPYLLERVYSVGEGWIKKEPRVIDYVHLIQSRIQAGDLESAKLAFQKIIGQDVDQYDLDGNAALNAALNQLTVALCERSIKQYHTDIMLVVDNMVQRGVQFTLPTIQSLCRLHLQADEYYEVTDLLKTHAPKLPSSDRLQLRDYLTAFCLDRKNKISRIWDTFVIFHQIFETETNREIYTKIMTEFYVRQKPDMGTHVFNIMRDHYRANTRATEDTYIAAFKGISDASYADGLYNVHNQLKLDMNVDPTTRICNALMLAYSSCGHTHTAWNYWRQITSSIEGPSIESILIVFRVCESMPFGEQRAVSIWQQFQRLDIDVSNKMFAAFVGALSANDMVQDSQTLMLQANEKYGVVVDELIVGTFLQTSHTPSSQQRRQKWAQEHYPDIYGKLEVIGKRRTGVEIYRLDRSLTA